MLIHWITVKNNNTIFVKHNMHEVVMKNEN